MSISIHIGLAERALQDADPGWINQQINERKKNNESFCLKVNIHFDTVNMILTSEHCCGGGGGAGRKPNDMEKTLFDLWNNHGLNGTDFPSGKVVSFLKKLKQFLAI